MKRQFAMLVTAVTVVSACSDRSDLTEPGPAPDLSMQASSNAEVIPGRFIITVREGISPATVAAEHGHRPQYVYLHALNGFAGAMSDAARDGLLRDARVSRVEPDGVVRAVTTQSKATWGLDRIDQLALPLSGTFCAALPA